MNTDANTPLRLDPGLVRNVTDINGTAGEAWLARLPQLLAECAERWSLTLGAPYERLSYNFVNRVVRSDGSPAVLKVGIPDKERISEIAALDAFEGEGMVLLFEADPEVGASVIERLEPGEPLNHLTEAGDDDAATRIAAALMRVFWRPAPDGPFPTVGDWASGLMRLRERFGGGTGPLPPDLVASAETAFADLSAAGPPMLLHGDLHHGNILSARREPWIAIDPKGLVGAPGYDAGNFLRSNLETLPDPKAALIRRIDILCGELDMEREDLRRWSLAQAVLSAWWTIEDHGDGWQETIEVARVLADLPVRG